MEIKKNGKKNFQVMKKGAIVSGNTLAPFTRICCYLKTKIFRCCLIWYVLFCFLLRFGLSMTTVYPVTTVTENCILSKCYPWKSKLITNNIFKKRIGSLIARQEAMRSGCIRRLMQW